jgi:hypothetical protein
VGVAIVEHVGPGSGRKAALKASIRSVRPTIVACLPPENSLSVLRASSTGSVRQPSFGTAKKFNSARLASWRACSGMSSDLVSTTKRARFCVTPCLASMVFLRASAQQILLVKLDAA